MKTLVLLVIAFIGIGFLLDTMRQSRERKRKELTNTRSEQSTTTQAGLARNSQIPPSPEAPKGATAAKGVSGEKYPRSESEDYEEDELPLPDPFDTSRKK